MKKSLILFLLLFLLYQTSDAQSYIRLHYRGDSITLDSAVVIDIRTYRNIRNYNISSSDLIRSKIEIITALENQIALYDSLIADLDRKIDILENTVARKDSLNSVLYQNFDQLDEITQRTFQIIEESNKPRLFFTRWEFWLGVGLGLAGGSIIVAR